MSGCQLRNWDTTTAVAGSGAEAEPGVTAGTGPIFSPTVTMLTESQSPVLCGDK